MDNLDETDAVEQFVSRYFEIYRELCSNSYRIYCCLFFGALGLVGGFTSVFQSMFGRPLFGIALLCGQLPLQLYFTLTFIRVPPPVKPRNFRRLLFAVTGWYTTGALILLAITAVYGLRKPGDIALSVLMLFGLFANPTLLSYLQDASAS